jgi:hypothetical protein
MPLPKVEPHRRKEQRFTPLNTEVVEVFMEIRRFFSQNAHSNSQDIIRVVTEGLGA